MLGHVVSINVKVRYDYHLSFIKIMWFKETIYFVVEHLHALNTSITYQWILNVDDVTEANNLMKDLDPTTPQEYILKGVVNAALGQEQSSVSFTRT